MHKIGIFPASGALATSIINHLLKLVPASQLILIARHPAKLEHLSRAGATIRHADYDDPTTLAGAFDGVHTLMLVSYASIEVEYRFEAHKAAITAARNSAVRHIFYSSLAFGGNLEPTSVASVMGAHLLTEEYLSSTLNTQDQTTSPTTYTAIREGLYSESLPVYTAWFDVAKPVSEITIPHSGSGPGIAWAKTDELGEATAKMIVSYVGDPDGFRWVNNVVLFSGPKAVSLRETVEILSRVTGRDVRIKEVSADVYAELPFKEKYWYRGVNLLKDYTSCWEAFRRGETAVVSPLLGEILGREPEDFETTVRGLLS